MNNKISVKEKLRKIVKVDALDNIKDTVRRSRTDYDPSIVFEKAGQEIAKEKDYSVMEFNSNTHKAMTLYEFENGVLMVMTIPESYRTFALNFSRNLQKEFDCKTPSEKSLAEVTTINFIRVLDIQQKIKSYLEMKTINQNGIGYLNIMSKELDRAERHYLTSLQSLRMVKTPQLEVSIRTQNAFVGNNQVLQKNEIN